MKYKLIDEEGFTKHGRNLGEIERYGIKVDGQVYFDIESIDHDGYGFTSCGWCILADSEFKYFEKVEEEEEEDFDRDLAERIYVAMLSRVESQLVRFDTLWERAVEAAKATKEDALKQDFEKDFSSEGKHLSWANTLDPSCIGYNHATGWTVSGEVHKAHYEWVNDFTATHPAFGTVEGNFEGVVRASSEDAFNHFYDNHTPDEWDYDDI